MKKCIVILSAILIMAGHAAAQNSVRLPEKPTRPSYTDYTQKDNGFWCALEGNAGSSLVFKHTNAQRAGLTFTSGYMFSEFLKAGLGLGANFYFNNNDAMRKSHIKWSMPIFADVRGNMLSQEDRSCVPYWSLDIGGAIRDGFYLSPTVGLRFGEKRNSWLLGISYSLNTMDTWKEYSSAISFFSLKFGYEF